MPLKSRSLTSEFFDILGLADLWPRKLWLVSSTSSLDEAIDIDNIGRRM